MAYLYNDTLEEWLDEDSGEIFESYESLEEDHRDFYFNATNLSAVTKLWRKIVAPIFGIPKPNIKLWISPDGCPCCGQGDDCQTFRDNELEAETAQEYALGY